VALAEVHLVKRRVWSPGAATAGAVGAADARHAIKFAAKSVARQRDIQG
jgi:hypothetical protein